VRHKQKLEPKPGPLNQSVRDMCLSLNAPILSRDKLQTSLSEVYRMSMSKIMMILKGKHFSFTIDGGHNFLMWAMWPALLIDLSTLLDPRLKTGVGSYVTVHYGNICPFRMCFLVAGLTISKDRARLASDSTNELILYTIPCLGFINILKHNMFEAGSSGGGG
jgi:hypothetical protein